MSNWRITFPIEKAEQREDGLYITGLASGPEIDATGERMSNELISRFADQINSTGGLAISSRLAYRDAHAPDGVLRDLGWVVRAWVNDQLQLAVEVKLDEENPAATYLFRALKRGKQYGMSVAGKVLDYTEEFVAEIGKTVMTYKDVILTEISNTTRPAWTPSFGSVLAKSLTEANEQSQHDAGDVETHKTSPDGDGIEDQTDDEAEAESDNGGVAVVTDELHADEQDTTQPVVEETQAEPEVIAPEVDAPVAGDGETTEKSDDDWSSVSAAYTLESVLSILADDDSPEAANLKDAANSILAFLSARVNSAEKADTTTPQAETETVTTEDVTPTTEETAEKSDSEDNADDLAKADETPEEETTQQPSVEELVRSLRELTAKVEELEKRPTTTLPPIVDKADDESAEDVLQAFKALPREQRLTAAFAAKTRGK